MRTIPCVWAALVLLGCAQFDPRGVPGEMRDPERSDGGASQPDANDSLVLPDAGMLVDGGASQDCDLAAALAADNLGAPQAIDAVNSSASDTNPFMTWDGMTLYFASSRGTGSFASDVWSISRAGTRGTFTGAPVLADDLGINSDDSERRVALSQDGTILVVDRFPEFGGSGDLFIASRSNTDQSFGPLTGISAINTGQDTETNPWLSPDGLRLYYDRQSMASGDSFIMVSERDTVDDPFGTPTTVSLGAQTDEVADPALTADELVLIYRFRDDIWYATRTATTEPFTPGAELTSVNSNAFDADPNLSPDGCELFFRSRRNGGQSNLFVSLVP